MPGRTCYGSRPMNRSRPLIAIIVALALATPSLFAAPVSRSSHQLEMQQLARDLDQVLGGIGRAEVSGSLASIARKHSRMADQLVAAMNRERAAYGLPPLHSNPQLALAATDRVNDMMSKHYFEHVSPDGIDPFTWADRRGYDYRQIGENLAVGYGSADAIVNGWMNSPAHRRNVLGRDFDEIGIAIAPRSPARPYGGPLVVALYGGR